MTAGFGPHLTPDEFDLWLMAELDSDRARHIELCLECQAQGDAERALDEQRATLPLLSPAPDFVDRVLRHVPMPCPLDILCHPRVQDHYLSSRISIALTPSIALLLHA